MAKEILDSEYPPLATSGQTPEETFVQYFSC